MGFKDWQTPPNFFAALNKEFHFTLDAAASHGNALCDSYCTTEGTYVGWDKLDDRDGLQVPWGTKVARQRVFCNPPYDSNLGRWVEKAQQYEADVAVLLLPPSVDTAWFHNLAPGCSLDGRDPHFGRVSMAGHVWFTVQMKGLELYFMEGRLKFWKDGKPGSAPRAGNLLAVFRR